MQGGDAQHADQLRPLWEAAQGLKAAVVAMAAQHKNDGVRLNAAKFIEQAALLLTADSIPPVPGICRSPVQLQAGNQVARLWSGAGVPHTQCAVAASLSRRGARSSFAHLWGPRGLPALPFGNAGLIVKVASTLERHPGRVGGPASTPGSNLAKVQLVLCVQVVTKSVLVKDAEGLLSQLVALLKLRYIQETDVITSGF